ncbi:dihydrolipoamide acetyltransferase family protein [Gammaproteobacteria bacterium AB-CW1]|uniref:Dihydrolipoamide acetyltransferase component of pyruvate dehydrogenase complex n=1 Tax=Natronospira elongata TaxID=3110268 RepID=A0AAP6JGK7_9GAMM|nr:dihydrolipoamide acetyltransferase family protein [Gammaproteobacteria bacterium AB-CW1]
MSDFTMPSMGADMEAGTLIEWKVQPGERVSRGQVIAVVDTAKAALDVEVFEDGIVEELYVEEGTAVPVGQALARIGDGQGKHPEPPREKEKEKEKEKEETVPEPQAPASAAKPATPEPAPSARRAESTTGRPDTTAPPVSAKSKPMASPAARRRAREAGVDLSALKGSGSAQSIVLADVDAAIGRQPSAKPRSQEMRQDMRQAIAAAMSRAKREIPHYYLDTTVDLHAAETWLADYNRERPPESRLLMAALFAKATALALAKHGDLNGHYEAAGFQAAESVNLGLAIHLRGGGLVAPAILDADKLALPELMRQLQDLVKRARSSGLKGSEMSQGTATLTNLGERGVDTVIGVIHPPQVAMIGFGRPRRQPVALPDGIGVHMSVKLSLAADHRVCDGHSGALFLNEIDQHLQTPEAL